MIQRFYSTGLLLIIGFSVLHGQSIQEKEKLLEFSSLQARLWSQERARAESLAAVLGLPIRAENPDGSIIELQRVENGIPLYYKTMNLNAARTISTTRVWPGGGGGFSLTGSTDTLGIWDGGKVRDTHQEFGGRVILSDGASTISGHSTHVAGTMIAAGVDAGAKGMSHQGRLRSYDWNFDISEMASAAAGGLRVSNHSYGYITGWYNDGSGWIWFGTTSISSTQDYLFGFYSSISQDVDNVAALAPLYLIVVSAGNDRGDGPGSQPVSHEHAEAGGTFTDVHDIDGGSAGYDCISHMSLAKNTLSVGAVSDIVGGYTQPGDVLMSSFSGWGPTDDGRVKPDIVANGISLRSSYSTSNTAYANLSGTSMASPNASGSLGLLLQLRKTVAGSNTMRSSTLKALVIHTADEAGASNGPDYRFGWGLMNTLKAAQVMRTDSAAGLNKNIRELTLLQGQTIDVPVFSDGLQPLRATICWTDPPGTPPPPSLNPTTPMLVNDVDLRIVQGPTTYYPWLLNPASPSSGATTGDNARDNVEQTHIASPANAQHTVRVTHKGTLSGGSQVVSLIITGGTFGATVAVTSPNGGESWSIGSMQTIQWSSNGITGNVRIQLSRNGGSTFSETLFASTANDGAEAWTVTGPVSSTARVRASSVNDTTIADTSNANFSIVQPTITVISPNGGETWSVGSSQTIQWTSADLTGNVGIELSTDGGATFPTVLASSTPDDGSEGWSVTGPGTTQARIRISSVSMPSVADTSNANFVITGLSITITTPNGGDTWLVGALRTISWTSMELTGPVHIELSRNGGGSYETLFASTADDGLENWVVTGPATSNALLRISSVGSPSVADVSDGPFIISTSFLFLSNIIVRDNGGQSDSLEFGTGPGATDGIDPSFGEYELPPVPPIGVFDVRWRVTSTEGAKRDIRDTLGSSRTEVIYRSMMQPGSGGHPFLLRWKPLELPAGSFTLQDELGGTSFVVNMKQQDSLLITDLEVVAFRIIYSGGNSVSSIVQGGWNIVSVPVTVADRQTSSVFPTATSNAFAFTPAGYVSEDTLDYGLGYWLKFPSTQSVSVTGGLRTEDTLDVVQGWNMIGSISCAVTVGDIIQIPAGLVESSYFEYGSSGYVVASSIEPMKGYWVKASQNGQLVLSCLPVPPAQGRIMRK